MVLVLCLIISHSKNLVGIALQINRYGHLLPKIHWDFFLQEGWGCLFSMTAAWKESCNYSLFRRHNFLFSKRCGGRRMGRGSSSIWIRILMYSDMYCFPFIVFLNVKLLLCMMSHTIYDKISNPVYCQYYMVFLKREVILFLTWPFFGLLCAICMEIQLHLQL